ncbi:hypothetical protein VB715_18845 [Crocosphaera sp. UHCC 0190]|uniref:hypothetical protein n=1 Tax=Crocosphaera sp. UHCC 0190 TaxID=3110246 RepID=UPI002B20F52D|nr:hypothetical protein [Crocosphaera sp. UHCC 0190]MEA5511834.1 hypothetical protein [Crocosphaera sp. UHCC 0190]
MINLYVMVSSISSNVLVANFKYPHIKGKPHWQRTIAVYTALDNAPGNYSYSQLMKWVKQQTGKGCSRKLISKWKAEKLGFDVSAVVELVETQPNVISEQSPITNYQILANNHQSPVNNHQSPVNNSQSPANNYQSSILSQSEKSQINYQQKSSIINEIPVVNEQINDKEKSLVGAECLAPLFEQFPVSHEEIINHNSINNQVSIIPQWLKKVGQIISLTTVLLTANFTLTPQDISLKLAVAEPPKTSIIQPEHKLYPEPSRRAKSVEPNRIKINLTITDPSDLKVKPGDEVVKGQVISDRTTERQRLLNQRKQLELSLKKLTIAIPNIQAPNSIAKLPNLPPISYQQEQATIQLKEQQLKEAGQAVSNQQQKIESIRQLSNRQVTQSPITNNQLFVNNQSLRVPNNQPSVNRQTLTVPSNQQSVTQQPLITNEQLSVTNQKVDVTAKNMNTNKQLNPNQKFIINIPKNNPDAPISIKPIQETVTPNPQPTNINPKVQAIIEHETAILNQLKGNEEKARQELNIAKSQLQTAKEQRLYAEHQLYLENNRRAIALQQQSLELERQRTIRAGQLQEQEYSKTQIEAKLIEIDNAINQLSTVKIPYNGTVRKVKWDGQTDHTLNVTVTLDVAEPSVSQESNN